MIRTERFKDNKGVTLIELLIVLVIIGIIAGIGMPQYGMYAAKNRVRGAATDLMQQMRMARTMSIKENRVYLITFNPAANSYSIGFDANADGDLADIVDVFGQGTVRVVNVQNEYGTNVVLGAANYVTTPTVGPNSATISDPASFSFMSDGSSSPNAMVYFQEIGRGYSFCVELANTSGKTNLFMWQGDANNTGETAWTELR